MNIIWKYILLFFIYSCAGWCSEVILSLIQHHKFINRGFLIGPLCPIYGFGGVLITIAFSFISTKVTSIDMGINYINIIKIFFISMIICSVLEYFTSWLMEKLFNNRWWDYSKMKYNLNGRICLMCSLGFGFGAVLAVCFANPLLKTGMNNMNIEVIKYIDVFLLKIFLVDCIISFNVVSRLKNISNSVRSDSTDVISRKVRDIVFNDKPILYKRLVSSFPTMKIKNKLSILTENIERQKAKLEKTSLELKDKRAKLERSIRQLTKEKNKMRFNSFINIFKK